MYKVIQFFGALSDGGAETLVKDYGLLFLKHPELNTECVLVALHNVNGTANSKRIKDSGVKVRYIFERAHSWRTSLFRELFGWYYVPYKLNRIISEEQPDAIHVHMGLLKYLVPISRKLNGIRLFYTCHNKPNVYFSGTNKSEFNSSKFLIENNSLRLIGLHDDMKQELNSMFNVSNTIVINNGIDICRYNNIAESKESIKERLGIPKGSFLVGHIGRFLKVKNQLFLLDVFEKLLKKNEYAWLLLIGNGPDYEKITAKAEILGVKDKVTILSHRTDIPELLKAMDVFVFPSLYEGLPITLIEAQAAGKRCIISDTINPQSILSNKTIPLSITDSPEKWVDLILDDSIDNNNHGNINEYDLNREIVRLSKFYKGEY